MSILEELSKMVCDTTISSLPSSVVAAGRRSLVDTMGLMAANSRDPSTHPLVVAAGSLWGYGGPILSWASESTVPPANAAFLGGYAAHSSDFDDTHLPSVLHPSASTVPAALTTAQLSDLSGEELLLATIVGDEVAIRLGMAGYDPRNANSIYFDRGQHATSICGTVGAAAAVSRVLQFDTLTTMHALSIACSLGSGIIEANRTGGSVKRIHTGWAAQAGLCSALLAHSGVTGPPTAIEGRFGFLSAHLGDSAHTEMITKNLGCQWGVDNLHIKPYPCNHFTHPVADAAQKLAATGVQAEDIAAVSVGLAEPVLRTVAEPEYLKIHPANGYAAKFSAPYVFAAAFMGKTPPGLGAEDFTDDAVIRPEILRLAARVSCHADPEATRSFPNALTTNIEIQYIDGSAITISIGSTRGGPRQPLSESELSQKLTNAMLYTGITDPHEVVEELFLLPESSGLLVPIARIHQHLWSD